MRRRDFLRHSFMIGASTLLPRGKLALATPAVRTFLTLPEQLKPDAQGNLTLTARTGSRVWRGNRVPVWGYNGNLPGPAIVLERGMPVNVSFYNRLPVATTVHWHGLIIPGDVDGGPHAPVEPGRQVTITFTPDQPAATCWLHPHLHSQTGYQVAQGLVGMVIINDSQHQVSSLPQQWGIDDIPLIFQDKRLTADGRRIDYKLDVMSAAVGWFGDLPLTNGAVYPQHAVPRGWLRFRLLNGSNARTLNLCVSDKRPLYVIASDGGLLTEPVAVDTLELLPGERFEVLIDAHDGKTFDIQTLPVAQLGMTLPPYDAPLPLVTIQPLQILSSGTLPDTLASLPSVTAVSSFNRRRLQLSMDPRLDNQGMAALMARYGEQAMNGMAERHNQHDSMMKGHTQHHAMAQMQGQHSRMTHEQNDGAWDFHMGNKINGVAFDISKPAFAVKRGVYEKWTISGEGDMMRHPFHIHGTQFRILSENGRPPAAHRQGWKDIVDVNAGSSEVLVYFKHTATIGTPYMAHCHLLEHEDTGMMLGFTVS